MCSSPDAMIYIFGGSNYGWLLRFRSSLYSSEFRLRGRFQMRCLLSWTISGFSKVFSDMILGQTIGTTPLLWEYSARKEFTQEWFECHSNACDFFFAIMSACWNTTSCLCFTFMPMLWRIDALNQKDAVWQEMKGVQYAVREPLWIMQVIKIVRLNELWRGICTLDLMLIMHRISVFDH